MGSLRVKRCLSANLPTEAALGEPIFAIDTAKLYFGLGAGQTLMEVKDGASMLSNLVAGLGLSLIDNELDIVIDGVTIEAANREVPAKPDSTNTDIYLPLNTDYNDTHGHMVTQYGTVVANNGITLNGSQYITVNGFDFTRDSWIIGFKWKPDTTHQNQTLLSGTGTEGKFKLEYNPSIGDHANKLGLSLGNTGTFDIGTTWSNKNDFSSNIVYVIKLVFNGTKYSLLVDEDETTSITSTTKIYSSLTALNVGVNTDGLNFSYSKFDNFAFKTGATVFGTPAIETYLQIKNVPANLVGDGSISNTEFGYLNGVTSNIQTQLDNLGLNQTTIAYIDQQDQALQTQITTLSTDKLDITAFNTEVSDIRSDFATADTALQGQINDISINTESVDNLSTRVSTIESEISNLSNTNSLPNLGTISKFTEENGILKFDNNDILTSNISTNINIFQPSNSPVTLAQGEEVTVIHNTCTNGKMMISIFEEEAGTSGLTNVEQDFDLADASKYTQEDSVTGTTFVDGKIQLKAINTSDSIFNANSSIPAMTSDTTSGYIASASSVAGTGFEAYKAFDGANAYASNCYLSATLSNPISESNPVYLTIDMGVTRKARFKKIDLISRNYAASSAPRNYILQGSNDANAWTDILSVTGTDSVGSNTTNTHIFSNNNDYEYYRLKITKSADCFGINWTTTSGLPSSAQDICQLTNGNLLLVCTSTSGKVYKSTNNGTTWDSGVLVESGSALGGITSAKDAENNEIIFITSYTTNKVYKSTDNGTTWNVCNSGNAIAAGAGLYGIIQAVNGNILTFGYTTNKVYKSTDNGTTWDSGTLVATGAGLDGSPVVLDNGDILIAGYLTDKVYKSTDNGTTWDSGTLVATGAGMYSLSKTKYGQIIATAYKTFRAYKSIDGGTTWYPYSTQASTCRFTGIIHLANDDLYMLDSNSLSAYRSVDGYNVAIGEIKLYEGIPLYSTIPKYITTSDLSQFNTSLVGKINSVSVTQTMPANTSIKALTSFDGRVTWQYYDADTNTFKPCSNGLSDIETLGNDLSFLAARFSNYTIPGVTSLNFAISLHTTNNTITPSLDQITYNYDENTHFELATIGRYSSSMQYGLKLVDPTTSRIKKLSTGSSRIFVNVMI